MAIFPGAVPPAGTAVSSDTLAAAGHAALHNITYDEIRALATKLGTGASTAAAGQVLRGTGAGTSAWGPVDLTADVTGVLPVGSGGLGQASLSGLALPSATLANPAITGTVTGGATYTAPTLTTPVIADLSSATHDHTNNAKGGLLGANAVGSTQIAADAVTDAKLIYGKVRSRQGGSATDWSTPGTNTYDYSGTDVFIQVGSIEYDGSGNDSCTFPTAFSQPPLVFATVITAVDDNCFCRVANITTTGFEYLVMDSAGNADAERISWMAIGQ